MFDKLRNLDQPLFSDPATLFDGKWVIRGLKLNQRPLIDGLRSHICLEGRTAATKMAEAGVPEGTMLAIMGHMSRAMLERYSHIRMAAKRAAVEALSPTKEQSVSSEVPTKVPTTISPTGLQ